MNPLDIGRLQQMYPGVYEQMLPYVQQTVTGFGARRNITEADINRMTGDVVRNSSFRGFPPGYTNQLLYHIARLMILDSLYNQFGYHLNPFWMLYFGGIPPFLLPPRPPLRPGRPPHGRPPHRRGQPR